MSVEVAEGMARLTDFLRRAGDPAVLFGAGIHDLTQSFGESLEIQAFMREGIRPLLLILPDRVSLSTGSLESSPIQLLVEPGYEQAVGESLKLALASKIVKITTDPTQARFVIGGQDFIQKQRENRLIPGEMKKWA